MLLEIARGACHLEIDQCTEMQVYIHCVVLHKSTLALPCTILGSQQRLCFISSHGGKK